MKIGKLDLTQRVAIVAEIGNNHEGSFDVACELVRAAAQCGVDAVKFQTFKTEQFISPTDTVRFARLKSFELTLEQFADLAHLAKSLGMLFLSTPLDLESAAGLESLVNAYKIASCDDTFYPLLERVAKSGKPVIISTGISDWEQVQKTTNYLYQCWQSQAINHPQLAVLHCVSSYPVPPEEANLNSIRFLAQHLDCPIGYSDHTIGIEAAVLSVATGARIVEKHFTLDKQYSDFRDHQLSADPTDLQQLVDRIRQAEVLLGTPNKLVQPCAAISATAIRRSIAAKHDLNPGDRIESTDLIWTRPGSGIAPGLEASLVGKSLRRAVAAGQQFIPADIQN
jgi:N,N'-diacetyllegionaminate synthase